MQITRTTLIHANPKLEREWAARYIDSAVHAKWVAAIIVDPINRDAKTPKLVGETYYPNGAVEQFRQE